MPRQNTAPSEHPQAVLRQIERLGHNIAIARKRRGESQAQWARKLGISQPTMARMERGDPSVAMASYVMCIWLINPAAGLAELIAPVNDHAALEQEVARVRVRRKPADKAKKAGDPAPSVFAKEPTDSKLSRTPSAEVVAVNGVPRKNSLEETIRAVSSLPPEMSVEAHQRKMREDFKRALSGISNPDHPLSEAQGIAALLAKFGPRKND